MARSNFPAEVAQWISQLANLLHSTCSWRLAPLLLGMLFAKGRRTVASWLRAGGLKVSLRARVGPAVVAGAARVLGHDRPATAGSAVRATGGSGRNRLLLATDVSDEAGAGGGLGRVADGLAQISGKNAVARDR